MPNPKNQTRRRVHRVAAPGRRPPGRSVAGVPLEAVVKPANRTEAYAVFVLDEQEDQQVARLRPVTLGDTLGNAIVVTDGLTVGQRVIVRGATLVVDGATSCRCAPVGKAHEPRQDRRPARRHDAQPGALLRRASPGGLGAARGHGAVGRLRLLPDAEAEGPDLPRPDGRRRLRVAGRRAPRRSRRSSRARSSRRSRRTRPITKLESIVAPASRSSTSTSTSGSPTPPRNSTT